MVWLYGFIVLLLIISGYLLFAPFYFEINSKTGLLQFRFHKLASARLLLMNNTLILAVRIAWWKTQIDLLQKRERKKGKVLITVKEKSKRPVSLQKIMSVLKSFKILNCHIKICFDDMAINGIFFPLVYWLGSLLKQDISINFEYENEIELQIKNSCARIIWAYVKS